LTDGTTRRRFLAWTGATLGAARLPVALADVVHPGAQESVEPQPYFAAVRRALAALASLGAPVASADAELIAALARRNDTGAVARAEQLLSRYTLANLAIGADGSARVTSGKAPRMLIEQGWRMFLVRVVNPSGRAGNALFFPGPPSPTILTPSALPGVTGPGYPGEMLPYPSISQRPYLPDTLDPALLVANRWLLFQLYNAVNLPFLDQEAPGISLSGLEVEYHVAQLYSQAHGRRHTELTLYLLSKTGNEVTGFGHGGFAFDCIPSRTVTTRIIDSTGIGCVAGLTITDRLSRVYPAQAMRLAPDMSFQAQVYRGDGETMRLPDGKYTVTSQRGPEYLPRTQQVTIDAANRHIDVRLERWIDPSQWGWYSGDTHIHAAGCSHYEIPTEGVSPETIIRQVRGEGLSVGDVLTWGVGWYRQKRFFAGRAESPPAMLEHPRLQVADDQTLRPHATGEDAESAVRYDVEVSGFPSSFCGHLVLLRLKDQDFPGTVHIEDWPSWNLPILRWARAQGGLGGYGHCGLGMQVDSDDLPNYEIPPMDGIGTQEAIVDVTHGLVDFLSGADTNPVAELNAWYHMMNCGFRMAMVGETDWPCITSDRVGAGRSYVRLDRQPEGNEGYEEWIRGLKAGRLYYGDGRSHFLEFKVNDRSGGDSDITLDSPQSLHVQALVAARLEPHPTPASQPHRALPGYAEWNLEWARIGESLEVPVELIVNGVPVARTAIRADGAPKSIEFKVPVSRSSWLALRILPSSHTYPIFVSVAGGPIRASKRSAQWCRHCVDKLWDVKSPFMRARERAAAAAAYEHARKTYDAIIAECEAL